MHQVSLFNRLDPERHDLYYLLDGLLARLEELGGPDAVSVLDFGCGPALTAIGFAASGYRTVAVESSPIYCDYQRFMAGIRGLDLDVVLATSDRDYYDTGADGHRYGVVVEWSAFEHIPDVLAALERVTAGLVAGGMFVTTTFCKDWTPELEAHYRQDAPEDGTMDQVLSPEVDAWLRERFDVLSPPDTLAKVLVRRPA